jgi:Cu+-exporting ATPase
MSRQEIHLHIEGMTCAACVARVERALKRVPGVHEAVVNLATESATVQAAPGAVPVERLLEAVEMAGYTAQPITAGNPCPLAFPAAPSRSCKPLAVGCLSASYSLCPSSCSVWRCTILPTR